VLAKESLGEHWAQLSESERNEFRTVLRQLVRNAYRKNLRKTLDYGVEYRGEEKASSGFLVRTIARHRTNPREEPVSIDYLVHKVDGRWRVHDIVTEGSSLVNNYKNQFRRVIKKNGFAELMRRMKKKLEKGEG
jgi:phospholipid transport system substrate-binding protein